MIRLGIDFGTSNTVAVLDVPGRPARPLLLDGSPQLPSAVFADPDGPMITGRDALHHARRWPERLAPHPKRHIDEQTVLLGDAEPTVSSLIGAVLRRVHDEATRVAGAAVTDVVVTHPASWGSRRRAVLTAAATQAGLPTPTLVAEPVAAATCFPAGDRGGSCVVVYDFGAGTFDASVVRRTAAGFDVLAYTGLADSGGLDVDAVVVAHLLAGNPDWDDALRDRLDRPTTAADRRARLMFWDDVRSAKEVLSRNASTFVHVPVLDTDVPLSRAQFERLARPVLDRTVAATRAAIRDAAVPVDDIAGIFLVGGSSRIPLCATLLHQTFGIAPTVVEQPELVVAQGALRAPAPGRPAPVVSRPTPVANPHAPVAGPRTPVASAHAPVAGIQAPVGSAHVPVTVPRVPVAGPRVPVSGGPTRVPNRPAPPTAAPPTAAPPGGDRRPRRRVRPAVVAALAMAVLVVVAGVAYAVTSWSDRQTPDDPAKGPSASTTSGGPSTFPGSVAGDWQGSTLQSDEKRYAVRMTLDRDRTTGTVAYPDLRCSGTLELIRIDGPTLTVRERIVSGSCTQTGTITLTVAASGLSFQYQPDDDRYTSSGHLNRP